MPKGNKIALERFNGKTRMGNNNKPKTKTKNPTNPNHPNTQVVIYKQQNDRITEVERDLWISPCPTPLLKQRP